MNDVSSNAEDTEGDDTPIKLFGDPRSAQVKRGPDRRNGSHPTDPSPDIVHHEGDGGFEVVRTDGEWHVQAADRPTGASRALRLGRGDGFATALNSLGIVVFIGSMVAGALILYNAQDVGAFSDPFDSNRVAIGISVLGLGLVLSALLVGVARVLTYQLATLRLKIAEADQFGQPGQPGQPGTAHSER